jgi:hydroxymethylbilane synthase
LHSQFFILIRIGTRGSDLALWQARYLQSQLKEICNTESSLTIIQTKGDKIQDLSFDKLEGKGFFTKELEEALINNEVDIAVHSMKDMPTTSPDGLVLAGISYREDCRDVLLIKKTSFKENHDLRLLDNAVVGTSSVRRKSQLLSIKPSLQIKDLRGNVPTRLKKLIGGDYDAIVLAKAGLNRLNLDLSEVEVVDLHPSEFIPAPAQGVLTYQCRSNDITTRQIILQIHNEEANQCVKVERKVLKLMNGGCQVPLGVHCTKDTNGFYHVYAAYTKDVNLPIKKIRVSHSTNYLLAEEVVKKLTEI